MKMFQSNIVDPIVMMHSSRKRPCVPPSPSQKGLKIPGGKGGGGVLKGEKL